MDPTGRSSSNSLNGGQQAASPNSVSLGANSQPMGEQSSASATQPATFGIPSTPTAGQSPVPVAQPTSTPAATPQPSQAQSASPTQPPSGPSSMTPSAAANISAFTSRRPSAVTTSRTANSSVAATSGAVGPSTTATNGTTTPSTTATSGTTTPSATATSGATNPFATNAVTTAANSGDIILNPNSAPQKLPKTPIIIGVIVIVLLAIAGIILMALNSNQATQTANTTESFNKFFNYLYSGEENATALEDPSEATSTYRLAEMLTSETNSTTRGSYFTRMDELWGEFESAHQQTDSDSIEETSTEDSGTTSQLIEDANEKVIFLTSLGTAYPLSSSDLIEYYNEASSAAKAKEKIASYYVNLTNSENDAIKETGDNLVEYSDAVIDYLAEVDEQGCMKYLTSEESALSDCPKYEQIDTTIEEEVENLQQNYNSAIATIGYQKNTLISDCISLSEQLNTTKEQE